MPFPSYNDLSAFTPTQLSELRQFSAYLTAWLQAQHKDDGSHGTITADSMAATGPVSGSTGTFTDNVTADSDGTPVKIGTFPAESSIRSIVGVDLFGSATNHWRIGAYPSSGGSQKHELLISDVAENDATGAGTQAYTFRLFWDTVSSTYILASNAGATLALGEDQTGKRIKRITLQDGAFDANGATAYGEWADVAFAAGNFTSDTGTWTLTAPDQVLLRYTLMKKTMTVTWNLSNTTVSGGQAQLRIAIPLGLTAKNTMFSGGLLYSDAGAAFVSGGNIFTAAGGSYIGLQPGALGAGAWAAAVNTTAVLGTFTFEVQ